MPMRIVKTVILVIGLILPLSARSQDIVPMDGPSVSIDSTRTVRNLPLWLSPPTLYSCINPVNRNAADITLFPETKEQKAFRENLKSFEQTMASVNRNLDDFLIVEPPKQLMPLLLVAGFFLGAPFSIPYGYVPMTSFSNPFTIAKIPGMAPDPDADKYSPENIPQCIRLEYDFATGTYKQVMVDWTTVQKNMSLKHGSFNNTSVPFIPLNDVERRIHSM